MARIHILGASASGTTTLGGDVAERLGLVHADADSFYWAPTDPPFTTPRPVDERIALTAEVLEHHAGWVFSGSALSWGVRFEPLYELIVFLRLDPDVRLARLRARERARYGDRIDPGGDMAQASAAFVTWAAAYDHAGLEQRSLVAQEAWLARQSAPILRLDSIQPVETLSERVIRALGDLA
jgi:adenylate kinase family enzyme